MTDFIGAISWFKAVHNCLGDSVVFALDEALMCYNSDNETSERTFDGYTLSVYGPTSTAQPYPG